jgi:hypothetical protein
MGLRGECGFSSLVKLKKTEKNYAVFYFAGKKKYFFSYL